MTQENQNTSQSNKQEPLLNRIGNFFWEMIKSFFLTLRAIIFVIIKTPYMLIPSSAHTSMEDEKYSSKRKEKLIEIIEALDIDEAKKCIIIENWIDQIQWTGSRATRERDANELIRWWQILLGILIPVLVNTSIGGKDVLVSIAGIFVAILTAIAQFRRPEERWRHYRVVHERYLSEFWHYIALSGEYQKTVNDGTDYGHEQAFGAFNTRMAAIKKDEVDKFFSEVVPPIQAATAAPAATATTGAAGSPAQPSNAPTQNG